jgi:hypothetical protein
MTRADAVTLALYRAKQALLADLKHQGEKVERIPMAERHKLALEWLSKHPELIPSE